MAHLVPEGHEKAVRQAFYTAAAMLFTATSCIAAIYVYYILELFIKPLVWALLCGSFLFPFKHSLSMTIQSWLKFNEENDKLLILEVFLIPMRMFDYFAETVGKFALDKWKMLLSIVVVTIFFYWFDRLGFYQQAATFLWHAAGTVWNIASSVEFLFQHRITLIVIFLTYIAAVLALEPNFTSVLKNVAAPAWTCFFLYLISLTGRYKVPLGLAVFFLFLIGIFSTLKETLINLYTFSSPLKNRKDSQKDIKTGASDNEEPKFQDPVNENKAKRVESKETEMSSVYFRFLFFGFIFMMIWTQKWMSALVSLALVYWCVKRGIHCYISSQFSISHHEFFFGQSPRSAGIKLNEFFKTRRRLLFPPFTKAVLNAVKKGDHKVNSSILQALPTVTSVVVILLLMVCTMCISTLFVFQIHQESVALVQMTSDLINETVSNHPEYKSWLPNSEDMQASMDAVVERIFLQGREWIKNFINSKLGGEANVTLIENHALGIWDSTYHSWFLNKTIDSDNGMFGHYQDQGSISGIVDLLDMSEIVELVKENMSSLMSILESARSILQTNMNLMFSSVTTVFTIMLSGGTAVINFVLSVVVFFTALFYLLAGSKESYIPIKLLGFEGASSSHVAASIQDSISGVFGASLKMAGFYGLYTWLNHTAMGTALVYLPSLMATIFSVVPIFTTYWACLPSFLELWLLRGDLIRGIVLIVLQIMPTMFVDASIYSEMTSSGGGHPYITGLAVAGGLYYFGLEGAIIGPIIWCILLVAVNIYVKNISLLTVEPTVAEAGNVKEEDALSVNRDEGIPGHSG